MSSAPLGYSAHTSGDRSAMLDAIGAESLDVMLDFIPETIRLRRPLGIPSALNEWQLTRHLRELASRNKTAESCLSFLGGGAYEHHLPAVVEALAQRGEFLTAYTPYQPEMSQGLLRVLFDFQRVLGNLLRMPVVNGSVYDGATAMAESAWMAVSIRGVRKVAIADSIWPEYRQVLDVYLRGRDVSLQMIPSDRETGRVDLAALEQALAGDRVAAVIVQSPNAFGVIEPLAAIARRTHAAGALFNVACYPASLGVLAAPGDAGADIVHAEGQSLGLRLNAGGPYLGIVATRDEFIDYLPGRLAGECQDLKGEHALALVRQEREQHVRRHEATSHICSNQAHMALRALIYLSVTGSAGLQRLGALNMRKARYLCDRLTAIPGVARARSGPFFNEFLLRLPRPAGPFLDRLLESDGIFGGIDYARLDPALADHVLVAVTETKTKGDLDRTAAAYARHLAS